ncbi:MAG TPA: CsbD family protein [Terracidiphilus sp.]|nr:CsbD family protein [Terracidiphilus sp.]
MNQSTKDQIEGAIHEAKGKVKETAGQVLGNPDLELEGIAENFGGKVQKKVGQIEQVFEN